MTSSSLSFVRSIIKESCTVETASFTMFSGYRYNNYYIDSLVGITITLPALTASVSDGIYFHIRKVTSLEGITFTSPSANIVQIDTLKGSPIASYSWTGSQTVRKFSIATIGGIAYWFVTNDS
jgi:hypothetical protein